MEDICACFSFFLNNLQEKNLDSLLKKKNTNKVSIYFIVLKEERIMPLMLWSQKNKIEYYKQRIIYSAISKMNIF